MSGAPAHTVLVVEDDPGIREFVALLLEDEGYRVQTVHDGTAAMQAIDQYHPPPERLCLILLDMMLPRANGLAVLEHLSQRGAFVPVVAMSASRQSLEAAARAGAHGTLPKPFDADRLLEVVERCCAR
jgi:two-component system, OmpR family, response regulator MprA